MVLYIQYKQISSDTDFMIQPNFYNVENYKKQIIT